MTMLNIAVSTLPYMGLGVGKFMKMPKELGLEIFCECGNDYYWSHWLPRLLQDRQGEFSVHGPFQNINLSDENADFEMIKADYIWAFEICKKYGSRHCVCHPFEGSRPEGDTPEALEAARALSLERVLYLNELAKEYGVTLLVENMPYRNSLLDQEAFINLFADREELHFLIDTGHAHIQKWDLDLMFEKLGDRIQGYHLHDNAGDMDSHMHVGEGTFDWDKFFAGYVKYTPEASLVCEYDFGPMEKVIESTRTVEKWILEKQNNAK